MYTIEEVLARINENPTGFSIAAIMVWIIGFAQYFYSVGIQIRERRSPWFFSQHAWYFAHDLTYVILYPVWFRDVDFWAFKVMWFGCIAFVLIELWVLSLTVRHERQEVFGAYADGPVTARSAWTRGLVGYALAFALFLLIRQGIGDPMLLALTMSTNAMVAIMPLYLLHQRRNRWGSSVVLGVLVVLGTLFTFAPQGIGYWTTAAGVFDQPWYYLLGAICLVASVWYVLAQLRLPKKASTDGLRPVF